ncbi:SIR2 family protein [Nocardioides sp. WS12]|uniref:SIR2 family protein n=1 Tax=Nocardioides sp. WS12 TaxID=2486272 RepID=UPI0015F83B55|nr:SIR2 family protein [Nocardioides sp. WS12]
MSEVLAAFENRFTEFADGFANGEYVLWLGSGISRERMPPVDALVEDVVELLRNNADRSNPSCRFNLALERVLDLTSLSNEARAAINYDAPVNEWTGRGDVVRSLVGKYSEVLNVRVPGEPRDFLTWTGLNVPGTYGNPDIAPDVEHYCIGVLMLEGVVDGAATSNWDGLIEKAVKDLTPDADRLLRVVVKSDDFRGAATRSVLIKFHGCAIRAVENEGQYRDLLIAREQQISAWSEDPANRYMRNQLESLLSGRNTLVVGLSVQDANMHSMFAASARDLARHWPSKPPALVLSERGLHSRHQLALELIYGDDYDSHEEDIVRGAVLGSYGKETLLGLLMWTLTEKLVALVDSIGAAALSNTDRSRLKTDLRAARTTVGSLAADPTQFLELVLANVKATMSMFRHGSPADGPRGYEPVTAVPASEALADPDFPAAQFGRFAAALSLLSRGHHASEWEVEPDPASGAVVVRSAADAKRVFVVRDSRQALALEKAEDFDPDDDVNVVIYADRQVARLARSPRGSYGRVGRVGAIRFSIESICDDAGSADDLYEEFKMAGAFG